MTFNEFIFKHTIRNKSLYLAYLLSTLTTVMTFFTFSTFAHHPMLSHENMSQVVIVGMNVSSLIIFVFSFFYVLYSMDIFLQSRKKEFGLLLIQGMSPKQLRKMVFGENTLVGFVATIGGILLGLIFSQLLLFLSKSILGIELPFYFPMYSIIITFIAFTLLFFSISLFIQLKIPKMDIQALLQSDENGKGELKVSPFKSLLAVLLIGGGYTIALTVKGIQVFFSMIPVILIVIVGTHFLFNQLSILVISRLKKNKHRFWNKTNMLVYSDLGFRMKDNARSFFLVSVITTVAFAAIGSLTGFKEMTYSSVDAMTYDFYLTDIDGKKQELAKNLDVMQREIDNENLDMMELRMKLVNVPSNEHHNGYRVISHHTYQELAQFIGNKALPDDSKTYRVETKHEDMSSNYQKGYLKQLPVPNQASLSVESIQVKKEVIPGFQNVYVVPKEVYRAFIDQYGEQQEIGWLADNKTRDKQVHVASRLADIQGLKSKALIMQSITDIYTPVLFVGFFIGAIFFVSAGSFLYFRLYSDMSVDTEKFRMVYQLGISRKDMKRMVYRQVAILFFTPIIVSSIHGIVALKSMYAMFGQGLQITAFWVIGIFLIIQISYYLIARAFYFKKLYKEVTVD